jgi:hypothetical protein
MLRCLFCCLALGLAVAGHAQEAWTKVGVPTTANLWGACYGGTQFVVVGEQGTILTSPDGTTWTQRTSGTTAWLNGVAWNGTRYVAVGDGGTILSSPDAVTWTTRATGGERLNGIAYGDGRFVAVGENGLVRASTDALAWTTARLPVGTWLRAVCFGDAEFLIGSGDGTLCSTEDGQTFRLVRHYDEPVEAVTAVNGAPLVAGGAGVFAGSVTTYLRGVARTSLWETVAVGEGGLIATVVDGPMVHEVTTARLGASNLNAIVVGSPGRLIVGAAGTVYFQSAVDLSQSFPERIVGVPLTAYVGQSIILTIGGRPAAEFNFQWAHNGVPIPGATNPNLVLRNVSAADGGEYEVTVLRRGGGSIFSVQVPAPVGPPSLVVDPRFRTSAIQPGTVIPLPDGRMLVLESGHFLWRLRRDGSWDTDFKPAVKPYWIALQPDGRILATYPLLQTGLTVVRLNPDGSLDSTFDASDSKGTIFVLPSGAIVRVVVSADNVATVVRLNPDGPRDLAVGDMRVPLVRPGGRGTTSYSGSIISAADDSGRLYLAATAAADGLSPGESCLFRLTSDARLDEAMAPVAVPFAIKRLYAIPGGLGYDAVEPYSVMPGYDIHTFGMLTTNGVPLADYAPLRFLPEPGATSPTPPVGVFAANGMLLVLKNAAGAFQLTGYDRSGHRDNAVSIRIDPEPSFTYFNGLLRAADGSLLVSGNFTAINGVPSVGLARLRVATDDPGSRVVNVSIRTTAGSGDQTLIAGFVVGGSTGTRAVLVRGVGPGLIPLGLTAAEIVPDPWITLFRRGSAMMASDNWDALALRSTADAVGAYPLTPGSLDAGLLETLAPGAYTVHVQSHDTVARIALVELYDADPAPVSAQAARLVNISGRAHVRTGSNVLIAGFVVAGESSRRVLIRGIGPGLSGQGVTGVLANPELLIHRSGSVVGSNDDWDASLSPVFRTVGAFALTEGSRDAALVMDLPPGVYTATVRGVGDTTGNAMVEVYELP